MARTATFTAFVSLVGSLVACNGEEPTASVLRVDSLIVTSASVDPTLDPDRTYEYDFSAVRPDSVLLALWQAGLPLAEAWLPIAYVCEDVRGPRLTVALTHPDERIEAHDFRLGTGRLRCSETLWQYAIVPADAQEFTLDATVRFVNVEGGCWALIADESTRFEPIGLPDAFQVDGLTVRATLKRRPDMASVCMIAPLAEVISIVRR